VQLDEVSFPIVLAWRLHQARALAGSIRYRWCARHGFLIREGTTTAQDRWEEAGGFSPSTLAIEIAALVCASELLAAAGDTETAAFILDYADFLESHVDHWTVTTEGTLVPGINRHYIRINPNVDGREDPNVGTLVWQISLREVPTPIPRRRSWTLVSSNSCATAFAAPTIPSSLIPSPSSMPR
jgi:glucoamylase